MVTDNNKIPMFVLTQEQINQIASIAGEEAVKAFRKEQGKAEKKQRREENKVRRTKDILRSYRRIKANLSEEAEFTEEEQIELRWKFIQDLMGNANEMVSKPEITIMDVEKRRQEDLYCIYCVDRATEMYRKECEESGNVEKKRRYRELSMMYLEEKEYTVQEIADIEQVSDKTVYKDLGIACGIVTVYLLGV